MVYKINLFIFALRTARERAQFSCSILTTVCHYKPNLYVTINFREMEDRVLNEKESIELITRMITQTKRKFETSDGNILIQWGWLTIAVAAIVMIALIVTEEPAANALWAMMALGSFFNRKKHNDDKTRGHTTYTDAISANIWKLAGFAFLPATAICVAVDLFMPDLADYAVNSIWLLFYITALVVIGIIAAVQGIIIKVGCLVFGGTFSAVAGICVVAAALCQIPVTPYWGYPLMMLCFILMMVIPGYVMRNMSRKENERT